MMKATGLQPAKRGHQETTQLRERRFIADHLAWTADLLELATGTDADAAPYRAAATQLRQPPELLSTCPNEDDLAALATLGADVLLDARSLWRTGDTDLLAELRTRIPAGVRALVPLNGLGPKRLRVLWLELGITDLAGLSHAVSENRLLRLPGFGPKTQDRVRQSVAGARLAAGPFAYGDVHPLATVLEHELRELLGAEARLDFAGQYRRGCTVCDGLEMLVEADHYKSVMLHMIQSDGYELLTASPDTVFACVRGTAMPITFHFRATNYYLELWRLTGSAEHVAIVPTNPQRIYRSEAEIYAEAGLPYVPAALREGKAELKQALLRGLPRLVHHTDIKGLLHCHTNFSDGNDSLEAMALHCRDMGMHYLGVTDHGPLHAGHAMRTEAIHLQHREIDRLNRTLAPFMIFKGIELDIQADGGLGMSDGELAAFDFVIASLHEEETLGTADATMRLIRAVRNPFTTILGHATGRLLFGRAGQPVNLEAVLAACAEHGVAVELNCHPQRMDLDWEAVRMAVAMGVRVAINPNAHSAAALHDYEHGIAVARKGMLSPGLTLNALDRDQFLDFLLDRRAVRIG